MVTDYVYLIISGNKETDSYFLLYYGAHKENSEFVKFVIQVWVYYHL